MAEIPLLDPEQAAAAGAALVEFNEGLTSTPRSDIAAMMAHLALIPFAMTQNNSRLTEQEEDRRLALYCRALERIPRDLLVIAFARVSKSAKFFPTPSEIADQVKTEFGARRQMAFELYRLLLRHRRDWIAPAPPEPPMTAEQVDEANRLFKSLGVKTRYRVDGEAYQLEPGMVDPVQADAA